MNRPVDDDDTDVDAIEYDGAVGLNMKGLIIDGEVFAWDIDPKSGMPEHDTIVENRFGGDSFARMSYMLFDGVHCCDVSCGESPFGNIASQAVYSFSGASREAVLRLESAYETITIPLRDYANYARMAPDPDDFDDGEDDAEYFEEMREFVALINTQKTARQLLGRGGEDDVYEGFSVYGNPRRKR
jgi:hypothetical protein